MKKKRPAKRKETSRTRRFTGLTQVACASVLGISDRHFRELVSRGVFTRPSGNAGFDLVVVVREWTAYVERGRTTGDVAAVKLRELEADARLKEAKADELEGMLLDVEQGREVLRKVGSRLAAGLDGIAGRIAAEVVGVVGGEKAKVREILFREHRKIRAEMADALEKLCQEINEDVDD